MALTLDERAERARLTLYERYEKLNSLWRAAEQQLSKYHIPHEVSYKYEEEVDRDGQPWVGRYLGVKKFKGKWLIYHGTVCYDAPPPDDEVDWNPITDCSIETRRETVKYLPTLREAIVKAIEEYVPDIDAAIEELDRFVNSDAKPDGKATGIAELLAERAKLNGKAT
jgi:hypothetical protein